MTRNRLNNMNRVWGTLGTIKNVIKIHTTKVPEKQRRRNQGLKST